MSGLWDLPVVFICENNHYGDTRCNLPVTSTTHLNGTLHPQPAL